MRRLGALVVVLAVAATGCGDDGGEPAAIPSEPPETVPPASTPTVPPTSETAPDETADPAPLDQIDLRLREVAELSSPTALAVHPDADTLFVAQRQGSVVAVTPGDGDGPGTVSEPLVDISADVTTDSERGLLGLAFAPDGEHVYLSYSGPDGETRIDEFAVTTDGLAGADGFAIAGDSRRSVFALDQPFANHNGGAIEFGPDGLLYIGLGDGGAADDPLGAGQDREQLLGSILRIDPAAGDGYGVPDDNPFTDGRPEIWTYGVRNPWRFTFDRATGDLWVADVGQNEIEEVNRLAADDDGRNAGRAANLGWNLREGTREFTGPEPPDHAPPVFTYEHTDGNCSVTGGYVYRGAAIPELTGAYLFGDYCVSELRGLRVDDGGAVTEEHRFGIGVAQNDLVSFGQGADGELYVLALSGTLFRIDPA